VKKLPVGVIVAAFLLTGCDNFQFASVTNGCGFSLDVKKGTGDPFVQELAVGDTTDVNSSGGPFKVAVRAHGAVDWPIKIDWSRIKHSADEDGIPYVIEGDECPAQLRVP